MRAIIGVLTRLLTTRLRPSRGACVEQVVEQHCELVAAQSRACRRRAAGDAERQRDRRPGRWRSPGRSARAFASASTASIAPGSSGFGNFTRGKIRVGLLLGLRRCATRSRRRARLHAARQLGADAMQRRVRDASASLPRRAGDSASSWVCEAGQVARFHAIQRAQARRACGSLRSCAAAASTGPTRADRLRDTSVVRLRAAARRPAGTPCSRCTPRDCGWP